MRFALFVALSRFAGSLPTVRQGIRVALLFRTQHLDHVLNLKNIHVHIMDLKSIRGNKILPHTLQWCLEKTQDQSLKFAWRQTRTSFSISVRGESGERRVTDPAGPPAAAPAAPPAVGDFDLICRCFHWSYASRNSDSLGIEPRVDVLLLRLRICSFGFWKGSTIENEWQFMSNRNVLFPGVGSLLLQSAGRWIPLTQKRWVFSSCVVWKGFRRVRRFQRFRAATTVWGAFTKLCQTTFQCPTFHKYFYCRLILQKKFFLSHAWDMNVNRIVAKNKWRENPV